MRVERFADNKGRHDIVGEKHGNANDFKYLEQRKQWTEYPEIYIRQLNPRASVLSYTETGAYDRECCLLSNFSLRCYMMHGRISKHTSLTFTAWNVQSKLLEWYKHAAMANCSNIYLGRSGFHIKIIKSFYASHCYVKWMKENLKTIAFLFKLKACNGSRKSEFTKKGLFYLVLLTLQ